MENPIAQLAALMTSVVVPLSIFLAYFFTLFCIFFISVVIVLCAWMNQLAEPYSLPKKDVEHNNTKKKEVINAFYEDYEGNENIQNAEYVKSEEKTINVTENDSHSVVQVKIEENSEPKEQIKLQPQDKPQTPRNIDQPIRSKTDQDTAKNIELEETHTEKVDSVEKNRVSEIIE